MYITEAHPHGSHQPKVDLSLQNDCNRIHSQSQKGGEKMDIRDLDEKLLAMKNELNNVDSVFAKGTISWAHG